MNSDIIFRADSICRTFGARPVLISATLWACTGQIAVVFGRNGSGKTTLLRIAAGVLAADQGVVLFRGRAWTRPTLAKLAAEGLFYLPERGLLVRNMTVRAHFDAVRRRFSGTRPLDDVVAELELGRLLDRLPDSLSGGERRRVEAGLALMRRPDLLLADEPLRGISPRDAELLVHCFRDLADTGCAVVLTGHEVPPLLDAADSIIWMVAGTTHSLGSPRDALRNWHFRREYLASRDAG